MCVHIAFDHVPDATSSVWRTDFAKCPDLCTVVTVSNFTPFRRYKGGTHPEFGIITRLTSLF